MPIKSFNSIVRNCLLFGVPWFAGCSDGPWYQLKKANFIYRKQWEQDRQLGPTFEDRRNELRALKKQMKSMSPEEQKEWMDDIEKLVANDPSPDMRREAILALIHVQGPESLTVLQKASNDDTEKVRLAVCEALKNRNDPQSLAVLGKMVEKDESASVRVAAVSAIGTYQGEEAKQLLAKTIRDRSPAMQYHSTLALKQVTGEDFGGDVLLWRRYLEGENVEPPKTNLAETIGNVFSVKK